MCHYVEEMYPTLIYVSIYVPIYVPYFTVKMKANVLSGLDLVLTSPLAEARGGEGCQLAISFAKRIFVGVIRTINSPGTALRLPYSAARAWPI